jgi:hypothetical protein
VCDGPSKKVLVTVEQKRKATYNWKRKKQLEKELFIIAATSISENVKIIEVGAFVDVKQMTRSEGFRRLCTGRVRMRQLEHEMKQEQRTDQN